MEVALAIAPEEAIEFERFRQFLKTECGIHLAENKQYLVQTRVKQILEHNKLSSLSELISRASLSPQLRLEVVDAMTTNETYWLRDSYPFELLKDSLLLEVQARKMATRGRIRIWSAAASSGQEAYSISMTVEETPALQMPVEIVASDISPTMLDQAASAKYDGLAMARGLSPVYKDRYFTQQGEDSWQVNGDIRRRVSFQTLNLMSSYGGLGKFDIIFCRNVLIYFDQELKQDILRRLHACLNPSGTLFLGASEGISGVEDYYEMINCRPGICYVAKPLSV
ncbi:protein-glutamate O-methyltransferase CheR [uncultured Pseudoteredinibacter sp.]|uniref:CheR family methyltransferase n=1 Tax=uncultured Pseudoteredinibacter sp. TaxID=1641701 RepID=UPI002635399A|nr:protein-glutamate O-methyltransferase CheR [uncultured Pseudoteredinibacter sp.]